MFNHKTIKPFSKKMRKANLHKIPKYTQITFSALILDDLRG